MSPTRHLVVLALAALPVGSSAGRAHIAGVEPVVEAVAEVPRASREDLAKAFDFVWKRFDRHYPYFELYGVDWDDARASFRPLALEATDESEFAHIVLRMLAPLDDAHVSYIPPLERWAGQDFHWHYPRVGIATLERSAHVVKWPEGEAPAPPAGCADMTTPLPQVLSIDGTRVRRGAGTLLAAGPRDTSVEVGLLWPDGSETRHALERKNALTPPETEPDPNWLVTRRVGDVGYLRLTTFSPDRAAGVTSAKEMRDAIDEALDELLDTRGLVIDVQRNGGGYSAVLNPICGRFVPRTQRYRVRGGQAKTRVVRPRERRYEGRVAVLVSGSTASAGEWLAQILRDAGSTVVIGEPSAGAEAPLMEFQSPDGAKFSFGASRLVQPGVTPFQDRGVAVDVALPMTADEAREIGVEAMARRVARARVQAALDALGSNADAGELVDPEVVSGAWKFSGD